MRPTSNNSNSSNENSKGDLFKELKENCPILGNANWNYSQEVFMSQIQQFVQGISVTKKSDIKKLIVQQEARIINSLQNKQGYNLYQEIGRVNPMLKKELDECQSTELPQKLEYYQKLQMRNMNNSPKSTEVHQNSKIEEENEVSDVEGYFAYNEKADFNKYPSYPIDEEIHDLFDKQPSQNFSKVYEVLNDSTSFLNNTSGKLKKVHFNTVYNLMEEFENKNKNMYVTDQNETFIKKCLDFQ